MPAYPTLLSAKDIKQVVNELIRVFLVIHRVSRKVSQER